LSGKTDSNILSKKGITIWEDNTRREFLDKNNLQHLAEGDIGPIYSFPLRHFGVLYQGMHIDYTGLGFDQVKYVLNTLKKDPYSRRIIMSTFDPSQAQSACLYPCHGNIINFGVDEESKLCCIMHQRSADFVCGVPWNIASYALLVHIMCELVNNDPEYKGVRLIPGILTVNLGDMHVYNKDDHIQCIKQQLSRTVYKFPKLKFNKKLTNLDDLTWDVVELIDYMCHPGIKVKMVA